MKQRKRGFTLIELLVVIAIIALLMGLLLPALAKALGNARVRKDQGQIKGIVATYSIYAEADTDERFPIPGEIDKLPTDVGTSVFGNSWNPAEFGGANGDIEIQGRGEQDTEINLTAWLHSAMIGGNFYDGTILISSNENSPVVAAKGDQSVNSEELAYDYEAVSPADDTYWDPLFSGDITGQGQCEGTVAGGVSGVCHTSYANLALCGQRLKQYWTNGDVSTVILSSRGPEHGFIAGDQFTKSPTLELYGDTRKWEGIYASADGSAHYAQSLWFEGVTYKAQDDLVPVADNAFSPEFHDYDHTTDDDGDDTTIENNGGPSGDTFMVLNVGSTETDVNDEWDILHP